MATAAPSTDISIKVMEDDLSCNICYNLLREPKDLDCPHVFCLQCLQKWAGKQPTVECPECRHVTIVPRGGLANLKTNLRLRSLAEKYAERNEKQSGVPICPNHEGEKQYFFCVTCGVTACHNCLVLQHRMPHHDVRELKDVAKTKKAEVKAKIGSLDKKLKDVRDDERKLDEMGRKLQAARKTANKEVDKHEQEIISQVQAKVKEMKGEIETVYQQRLAILEERQQHTKDKLTGLQNICPTAQNVVDTTADHVFMKQHGSLIDRMNSLCMTEQELPSLELATLQFKPGSSPVNTSWFGELVSGGDMATSQFNPRSHPFALGSSLFGGGFGGGNMATPQFNPQSSPKKSSSFLGAYGGDNMVTPQFNPQSNPKKSSALDMLGGAFSGDNMATPQFNPQSSPKKSSSFQKRGGGNKTTPQFNSRSNQKLSRVQKRAFRGGNMATPQCNP